MVAAIDLTSTVLDDIVIDMMDWIDVFNEPPGSISRIDRKTSTYRRLEAAQSRLT
ncbi:hypothetical protein [Bradyrhizobium erythrophlei]|uniref:Transposase n=1 Tax=Bradyrhizobium erythrophlei TaxID=1437360 RepID=A0A1H4WXP2_9BRAD|nr:hypothetical protein [Bradyrhizobium erythrophlei]SEC98116.1 hypothetical protein SAMN05444164_3289 [Bradyrhizobium erythrophlei]